MSDRTSRVLVLGSDTRAFLTVVRSLGRRGLEVHVAWGDAQSPALRSRYVRQRHDIPRPRSKATEWASRLIDVVRRTGFDVVIPCDDPSLLPVQSIRRELEAETRVAIPPDGALAIALSKVETWLLARRLNIPVPDGRVVTATTDAAGLISELGLPLVLKPDTSFTTQDLGSKRAVRTLRTTDQVHACLSAMKEEERFLAQRFFTGIGTGVEFLAREGGILFAFQHQRVHEPLTGGGSSYRVSVPLHSGMLEASAAIVRAVGYTGVGMVEFKLADGGGWSLVEINPRFWGSLPLAVAAGADFPYFLYEMLAEGRREFSPAYRTGVYARNWVADLHWLRANLAADKSDATLLTRPTAKVLGELVHVMSLRERSDTFTLDDPAPAFAEVAQEAKRAAGAIRRRLARKLSNVSAIRAARGKRARHGAARASSILFVCKGNICRSPFAAAYATGVLNGLRVASAGYLGPEGRTSPDLARRVAREFGVDLERHRSVLLTSESLDAADIVFVFDRDNMNRLSADFPRHRSKLHLLGSLLMEGDAEIADPYGESADVFHATYSRIAASLDALAVRPRDREPAPRQAVRAGS